MVKPYPYPFLFFGYGYGSDIKRIRIGYYTDTDTNTDIIRIPNLNIITKLIYYSINYYFSLENKVT